MTDLSGKIALVTGASRGIGQATATALAGCGADVAINFRKEAAGAQDTLERVRKLGRKGMVVQADVSRDEEVVAMAARVGQELGPVDILINNAGWAHRQTMDETSEADWDAVLAVNLKSVFLVTRAVLPHMRERRWGRIVNVSSGAAHTGGLVGIHYTAAKAGMDGLSRAYASRLIKEGITVNVVAPALIETGMSRDNEARRKMIPLGRQGRPEEVAEAIVLCVSNEYMTGQTIHLNGGLYFR